MACKLSRRLGILCYYTSEMACPFFHPSAPLSGQPGSDTAIFPLGDCFAGACHAQPGNPLEPDHESLRRSCNFGYARGICPRFPHADCADAVRFTISRDDASGIGIYYVMERDHHPYLHGPLAYSQASGRFEGPVEIGELLPQAQAYLSSYLRRKA